jgi:hypothetical protein
LNGEEFWRIKFMLNTSSRHRSCLHPPSSPLAFLLSLTSSPDGGTAPSPDCLPSHFIPSNGHPWRRFFCRGACRLNFWRTQTQDKTTATMVTDPASFIMDGRHPEWQPRRAALPISSVDSVQRSVAARRSWAAPGMSAAALLSLTHQFTL